jgi:putative membrane protein
MAALIVGYLLAVRVTARQPVAATSASEGVTVTGGDGRVGLARQVSFFLGVAFLWLGADWPVHEIAEERLFSIHMVQHTLFSLVAPPLLLLGLPPTLLRRVFRSDRSLRVLRLVTRPIVALALFNGVVLVTHWPLIVDASLRSEPLHFGLHAVLFTSAIVMWWPVVEPLPELKQLSAPGKMLYLFLQSILPTVPASFLTFADAPIYHFYESVPRMWGLSVLNDQRIAGLIMKIGGGLLLWLCIATIFFRWNAKEERGDQEEISWEAFERELDVWELRKR